MKGTGKSLGKHWTICLLVSKSSSHTFLSCICWEMTHFLTLVWGEEKESSPLMSIKRGRMTTYSQNGVCWMGALINSSPKGHWLMDELKNDRAHQYTHGQTELGIWLPSSPCGYFNMFFVPSVLGAYFYGGKKQTKMMKSSDFLFSISRMWGSICKYAKEECLALQSLCSSIPTMQLV